MKFVGFDTFSGLPKTEEHFKEGQYCCGLEAVKKKVGNKPVLVRGEFKDSLKKKTSQRKKLQL